MADDEAARMACDACRAFFVAKGSPHDRRPVPSCNACHHFFGAHDGHVRHMPCPRGHAEVCRGLDTCPTGHDIGHVSDRARLWRLDQVAAAAALPPGPADELSSSSSSDGPTVDHDSVRPPLALAERKAAPRKRKAAAAASTRLKEPSEVSEAEARPTKRARVAPRPGSFEAALTTLVADRVPGQATLRDAVGGLYATHGIDVYDDLRGVADELRTLAEEAERALRFLGLRCSHSSRSEK